MPTEIKMPQLGESVVEGTITKWLKQEGDSVDEDELLVEVSTDKVDSEVPSSASGTIQEIKVQEGETVKVGEVIAVIGEGGSSSGDDGQAEASDDDSESGEDEKQEDEKQEDDNQEDEKQEDSSEDQAAESGGDQPQEDDGEAAEGSEDDGSGEAEEEAPAAAQEESDDQDSGDEGSKDDSDQKPKGKSDGGDTSKRGIISPLVRRLADEHEVDLDDIDGSGTGGRIRKQDVLKYVETGKGKTQSRPAASAEPAPESESKPAASKKAGEREELVPWTNIRRRTAEHMVASARETARAWNAVEVDWTNVVKLREKTKDAFKEREGFNLTYMGFLGRALCEALLEMPEVNASFDEENQANRIKHYVNLGIAVALEGGGLIVPVIKNADELNLVGLSRQINEVAQKARSKKLSPDDLTGGTFTITNPGPFGSVISVPIIPRGQAAILGFETIRKGVVVTDDDTIAIRSIGILDLSWDHRVIDGAEAARFLSSLKERIETMDFSGDLSQYL